MRLRRGAPARHSDEPLLREVSSVVRELDQMVARLERHTEYLRYRTTGSLLPPDG